MRREKGRIRGFVKALDKWDMGLLVVCLAFYLFFTFYDGPVWCKDSMSYATMSISREPLYPTFLWIFRRLFGEEGYLMPVVIAQSLLAAYAAFSLAVTVKRYMSGSRVLAALCVLFQFAVTILSRFVAIRGSSYIDSIMTEGLGLSLYVLFMVQLYRYLMERRGLHLAGTAVFALLLVNLRKQMMITLCVMAAMFVLYDLVKRRKAKRLVLLLVMTAAVLFLSKFNDRLYNHFVRDAWVEHSGNSMGVLCTFIYTAGEEDTSLFEDETLRGMFEEILRQAEEQGLRVKYAPRGWTALSSHYADSYDAIGYGIINPVVQGYIAEHFDAGEVEAAKRYDEYCGAMTKTLLGQEKGDLFRVFAANILKGFINSIARVNRYLNVFAAAAYLLYLGLYAACTAFIKKRGGSWSEPDAALTFAELIFVGILVNSAVVGVTIFAQPRYMIYHMGLFYAALSAMLYDVVRKRRLAGGQALEEHSV